MPALAVVVVVMAIAGAPPPPAPPPPAPPASPASPVSPAPPAPTVAFVVDASAVVRAEPRDDALAVREVPIWTAVRVDEVKGEWARVVVGPRTLRFDSPGGEARPVAPTSFDASSSPTGYLRATSFDASPLSRQGLVAAAKAAAADDKRRTLLLRAFALDPNDAEMHKLVAGARTARAVSRKARPPFQQADLVFGCRGDVAGAVVVGGGLLGREPSAAGAKDVCLAHVDVRASCNPSREVVAEKKAAVARFVARFGNDGPALRLVAEAGGGASDRPVYVVTRLLAKDGCSSDCNPVIDATDVKLDRLRVPLVDERAGRTTLFVMVPRYAGALYDVVAADRAADVDVAHDSFELGPGDAFDVDPRGRDADDADVVDDDDAARVADGSALHLFMAPEACCACDDEP